MSIDENDLDRLYADTLENGKRLMHTTKSSIIRKYVQDRLARLQVMQSSFQQFRQTGGIREKPYCVGIFGGSSVGKSTIGPLLMVSTLIYNGFRADDESMIVLNEHDKFMSNYKSSINGVFLDDVGNTKADFVETAPTVRILELVNNVKMYANMAEADLKGKVSIQPKCVITTTNVKDFCATTYSNEPVSIARRANYIVTTEVRPQFSTNNMLDEKKVFDFYGDNTPEIPDLWTFTAEKAYPVPNRTKGRAATIGWKTLIWNGQEMSNIDIFTLMRFTNADSRRHFEYQRKIVHNNSNLSSKLTFCPMCKAPSGVCMCDVADHVVTYVDSKYKEAPNASAFGRKTTKSQSYTPMAGPFSRDYSWNDMYTRIHTMGTSRAQAVLDWTPNAIFNNHLADIAFAYAYGYFPRHVIFMQAFLTISTSMVIGYFLPYCLLSLFILPLMMSGVYMYYWTIEYNLLIRTTRETRLADYFVKYEKAAKIATILGGCFFLTFVYRTCVNTKKMRDNFYPQGMMHPSPQEIHDIDANDVTSLVAKEMNWANIEKCDPIPVSDKSTTTTFEELAQLAQKNMTFMSFTDGGTHMGTNAFFLCSNVAIMPRHAWKREEMLCTFVRQTPTLIGGNFSSFVSRSHSVDILGTDCSLIWVPNGGSWKDLRDYFPQIYPSVTTAAEFMWKDHAGDVHSSPTKFVPYKSLSNGFTEYTGGLYSLSFLSKNGMCMGPIVSQTKSPYFLGFHLGGIEGTPKGSGGTILRSEIDSALLRLEAIPSVLICHSESPIDTTKYQVQFLESTDLHAKSPVRQLPILDGKTPNIKVFGSCKGRATYYSKVVQSRISPFVKSVCGVPNLWGKPQFNKGDPWLASLTYSSQPSHGVEGNLLSRATMDYIKPFVDLLETTHISLRETTKPLTRMETICGIDGKKFVSKMPPKTAVGPPLSGPKSKYLTELDPASYEAFQCPMELDAMFWEEFDKAVDGYKRGERYNPIFKACLKDEPTPNDKEKVRVFQAAPIVLQLLIRKYFLPVARIISLFPAMSECGVGINPMGPDWDELAQHMKHFGEDRILAGDYSKYDLRMPAQVMFAAFHVLIVLAEECGYSEEDIVIMQGIATDVCYPVMAYNGDLIQTIGSNPSGQNLTVYINSIVNSLLFRCAFYHQQGVDIFTPFRDVVKLMTYGDDVKGSVKTGHDDFNHLYVAQFFADRDMKFTMPDKTSIPVPFMTDTAADFLKRKNVYCAETGHIMGALDEMSIFKSLHSNLQTKITRQELAAQCVDGALREWFNHGREVYEHRRQQMIEVADKGQITHICSQLDQTFDDQVVKWHKRYIYKTEPSEEIECLELYTEQAGEYCFVSAIVPIVEPDGTIINSFQIINCGSFDWSLLFCILLNLACLVFLSYSWKTFQIPTYIEGELERHDSMVEDLTHKVARLERLIVLNEALNGHAHAAVA